MLFEFEFEAHPFVCVYVCVCVLVHQLHHHRRSQLPSFRVACCLFVCKCACVAAKSIERKPPSPLNTPLLTSCRPRSRCHSLDYEILTSLTSSLSSKQNARPHASESQLVLCSKGYAICLLRLLIERVQQLPNAPDCVQTRARDFGDFVLVTALRTSDD